MSSEAGASKRRSIWRWLFGSWASAVGTVLVVITIAFAAPSIYYERSGSACASCHEIWQPYTDWHSSTHRNVPCSACHGNVLTLNAGFHLNNMRRVFAHLQGDISEKPRLKNADVLAMTSRCRSCHEQEFAGWRASRHSTTYADIFLNTTQNQKQKLMDDCLRCHAMYFQGGIRDLVTPLDSKGPWQLREADLGAQPAVPCQACHQVHREGAPLSKSQAGLTIGGPQQEITRPSLAFFDRREFDHIGVDELPLPSVVEGKRPLNMSHDQRQALCYQCHAPLATRQVNSGDDRTPMGVHEGLSCFSCHLQHGEWTRASCDNCHAQHQACGLNVEEMDTTFKDNKSKHNVHFVKCTDCHLNGVPKRKQLRAALNPTG